MLKSTAKKLLNNTAVVVNAAIRIYYVNTNTNKAMTREEFDKDKAKYEAEAKESKSTIGTGANDLWLWTKTRAALRRPTICVIQRSMLT